MDRVHEQLVNHQAHVGVACVREHGDNVENLRKIQLGLHTAVEGEG